MKVVSPSLSVYKIQVSSIFSILERITGVVILFFLLLIFYLEKLKLIFLTNYYFYSIYFLVIKGGLDNFIIIGLILFLFLNFSYHLIFGFRYLLWDSYGMGSLVLENLQKSVKIFLFLTFIFFLILLILIIL